MTARRTHGFFSFPFWGKVGMGAFRCARALAPTPALPQRGREFNRTTA